MPDNKKKTTLRKKLSNKIRDLRLYILEKRIGSLLERTEKRNNNLNEKTLNSHQRKFDVLKNKLNKLTGRIEQTAANNPRYNGANQMMTRSGMTARQDFSVGPLYKLLDRIETNIVNNKKDLVDQKLNISLNADSLLALSQSSNNNRALPTNTQTPRQTPRQTPGRTLRRS